MRDAEFVELVAELHDDLAQGFAPRATAVRRLVTELRETRELLVQELKTSNALRARVEIQGRELFEKGT